MILTSESCPHHTIHLTLFLLALKQENFLDFVIWVNYDIDNDENSLDLNSGCKITVH